MTIGGQNFEIFQGDNHEITITVREDDGSITNLTGYSAVWCVHNQTLDNVVFQKTTTAGGITIPSPTNGQLIITLEQEDTASLAPKNYGHQCEIEDSLGNHSTITTGYMKVKRSITHLEL